MGLSIAYGAYPHDDVRLATLNKAVEVGSTFIDTAAIYGDSELLIGRWLREHPGLREKIFLATKVGVSFDSQTFAAQLRGDAAAVTADIEKGLGRLGVDTVDLLYVHRIDASVPIEETIGAIVPFIKAGRVRHIGLSEMSADTVRRAHAVHPISAVQVEYSPFTLDIENNGVLEVARELGIAIVAYSPLGRGILTGQYKSAEDFGEDDTRRFLVSGVPAPPNRQTAC